MINNVKEIINKSVASFHLVWILDFQDLYLEDENAVRKDAPCREAISPVGIVRSAGQLHVRDIVEALNSHLIKSNEPLL